MNFSSINGNYQKLDGGAMFGNVPKALWKNWFNTDSKNRILLACRSLLIEFEDKKILFEAGIGSFFEPKLRERFGIEEDDEHLLLENIKTLNIDPSEIDYVILSHLHFDHAGGILPSYKDIQSGKNEIVFPNAKFIVSKKAWERANNPHLRDKASFIPMINEKLKESKRLIINEEKNIKHSFSDRLSFIYSNGHTPGQMHSLFKGNDSYIFFAGDLIPGVNWIHLPITMGYDRYPELLIDEKKEIYSKALKENWIIFYTHDPKYAYSNIDIDEKNKYISKNSKESATRIPF